VFGIRATSHEDPAGSAVEEGTLSVAAFADTFTELLPRTSTGSLAATHSLAIDNRGNAAVNATVSGTDPDDLLRIGIKPPGLVVDPGTAAFASVRVAPRKKFWRGRPKTRPFKVQVEAPGAAPQVLDGTLLQQAILPGWLMKALLACLVLALLAVLLWFGLFQPAMKSTAQQALVDAGITPHPAVPTVTAGAGATPQPCNGINIGCLFRGESAPARDTLCWHYPHYSDQGGTPTGAIRQGDWKLIEFFEDSHVELYNLVLDPGEQYDFSSSFAPKAEELRRKLHEWRAQMSAAMPAPNPEYDPALAYAHQGPSGCSWQRSNSCKED